MADKSVATDSNRTDSKHAQPGKGRRFAIAFVVYIAATVAWWYLTLAVFFEPLGFMGPMFTLLVSLPLLGLIPVLIARPRGLWRRLAWLPVVLAVNGPLFMNAYYLSEAHAVQRDTRYISEAAARADDETSAALLGRAWHWMPFSVTSAVEAGDVYRELGRPDEAIRWYDRALAVCPWSTSAGHAKMIAQIESARQDASSSVKGEEERSEETRSPTE